MSYFRRFLIFGLLAELLTIKILKKYFRPFSVVFHLHPPQPPSGEQTHHVIKIIKDPSKDTLLSLNCSITVTLVIKIYLEINYLIIINNATMQRQQSSF
jgi:hypothetical protein